MNHDSRRPPPHTALKDYLAALHISSLSSSNVARDELGDDEGNKDIQAVSSSQTGKIPFILVDDNMKATPSFLLASTTPPKTVGRHRPLNRTNSLPTRVSSGVQPRKSSSSTSTISTTAAPRRKKSHSSGLLGVDKKKRTSMLEQSQSSSLVQLLHPRTIRGGKERQDVLLHDHDHDDDDGTTTKIWCRWDDFTSRGGNRHHDVDTNSKNDDNNRGGATPTSKSRGRKSHHHDQGVPLPTRTVEEHDA